MTTSTNENEEDRPIEKLIKMTTFQDMKDTEIISLMTYASQMAAEDAYSKAKGEDLSKVNQAKAEYYKSEAAKNNAIIEQINSELKLKTVPLADDSNE